MSADQLEEALGELKTTERDQNRANRALSDLRTSLDYILETRNFWINQNIDRLSQRIKNEYKLSSRFSANRFDYNLFRANGALLEIAYLLYEEGLNPKINSYFRHNDVESFVIDDIPSMALHTSADRKFVQEVGYIFSETLERYGEAVVTDTLSQYGFNIFSEGTLALRNVPILYRTLIAESDYYVTDGGRRPITDVLASAGQIVSGGIAVGHDAFVAPDVASIAAGGGLIAAGLGSWPERTRTSDSAPSGE